jgi:hypothetical protein
MVVERCQRGICPDGLVDFYRGFSAMYTGLYGLDGVDCITWTAASTIVGISSVEWECIITAHATDSRPLLWRWQWCFRAVQ